MDENNEYDLLTKIKIKLDWLSVLISQDVFDFKCHGTMEIPTSNTSHNNREQRFKELLREYSELQKQCTKLWQQKNGFGNDRKP